MISFWSKIEKVYTGALYWEGPGTLLGSLYSLDWTTGLDYWTGRDYWTGFSQQCGLPEQRRC